MSDLDIGKLADRAVVVARMRALAQVLSQNLVQLEVGGIMTISEIECVLMLMAGRAVTAPFRGDHTPTLTEDEFAEYSRQAHRSALQQQNAEEAFMSLAALRWGAVNVDVKVPDEVA